MTGPLLGARVVGHEAMANDGEFRRVRAFSQFSALVHALFLAQESQIADLLQLVARTAESITLCRVIGWSFSRRGRTSAAMGAADAQTAAAATRGGLVRAHSTSQHAQVPAQAHP